MEKIRRALKIYLTEHGTPILFWTIFVIAVILIVQGLNSLAIKKQGQEKKDTNKTSNTIQQVIIKEDKENTILVNQFLEYCKNKQIKEAYNLLSENCKKDLYHNIKEFENNYYNKLFNKNYDIEAEYESSKGMYKISFLEDILESGKIDGRDVITDYYKVEEEILEKKIYININQSIK